MSLTLLTTKIDKISKITSQYMFKVSKTLITMAVSFGQGIDDWNQCAPCVATTHSGATTTVIVLNDS